MTATKATVNSPKVNVIKDQKELFFNVMSEQSFYQLTRV
jgi:hypothetical protein